MSFIVKGINLPEEGQQLRIIVNHNGQIIIDKRTYTEEAEAIQIPSPHGDLVDRAEIEKLYYHPVSPRTGKRYSICMGQSTKWQIFQILKDFPTILEAEE